MAKIKINISITIDSKNSKSNRADPKITDWFGDYTLFELENIFNEIHTEDKKIEENINNPNSKGLVLDSKTDNGNGFGGTYPFCQLDFK